MDPLTLIHTALIAVPPIIGTELCKKGVSEAYEKVKSLIKARFGDKSRVVQALAEVEENPTSTPHQELLRIELSKAGADKTPELELAAKDILKLIEEQPGGVRYVQTVTGNSNITAQNSTITIHNGPKG